MYDVLKGLRVIEGASFIAAPSCGLHLLQFGADVIRFDDIHGGPDFHRWPKAPNGASFYWEGLNKGKKSIAVNLQSAEGRELITQLIGAPGEGNGIFLTNFPAKGFLAHDRLVSQRPDLITIRVMGWADGTPAVDYTVNSAVGIPQMTGSPSNSEPVNHVLPAWDLLAGAYAAFGLLALERRRRISRLGGELRLPLSDLAISSLGHLGQIAEVTVGGADRPRMGNDLFGAFGRDFMTADGQRIMVVALTSRQWSDLIGSLAIAHLVESIQAKLGVSFADDAGLRFQHRDELFPIVESAIGEHSLSHLASAFKGTGVCWGPYQTLKMALETDARFGAGSDVLEPVDHVSGFRYPTPGFAGTLDNSPRLPPRRAPRLGEHTDEILSEALGLSSKQIGDLLSRRIVADDREARKEMTR